jgi:hypothetical protein
VDALPSNLTVQVVEVKDDLGVDRKDGKKIEERLVAQGVKDIAKISLSH